MRRAFCFVLLATIGCGGATSSQLAPEVRSTPEPATASVQVEPVVEAVVEPELEPELVAESEPVPSMDPVDLGIEAELGCGRFLFQLPNLGEEEEVRVESHSCNGESAVEGAGWIGGISARAHAIVGPCDIYMDMREESHMGASLPCDGTPHPSGATLYYGDARHGELCLGTEQGSMMKLTVEADRDSCVEIMHQVVLAVAQSLHVPPMPEDRRVRVPVSAHGHNILITVPDDYVLEYTGAVSEQYEFSWWLRPLAGGAGIRFFGYNPGDQAELGDERLVRSRALGALRSFVLSPGGGFVETTPRGLAFVRASNRRAEIMISIPAEESPERVILLEALETTRWGTIVRTTRQRSGGTALPGDHGGIIPTR